VVAYNEYISNRLVESLNQKNVEFELKKMFGGICFMVQGKMCLGVIKDRLMVRLDPALTEAALTKKGCIPMDFTGRPMKGFVFVESEGFDLEKDLTYWVECALEYNPKAKSSQKTNYPH